MNVIREDIQAAVKKELASAKERFPMYASLHEATAMICEERDEAADELEVLDELLNRVWISTKKNDSRTALQSILKISFRAEALAIEACQIAAVCEKAIESAAYWIGEGEANDG